MVVSVSMTIARGGEKAQQLIAYFKRNFHMAFLRVKYAYIHICQIVCICGGAMYAPPTRPVASFKFGEGSKFTSQLVTSELTAIFVTSRLSSFENRRRPALSLGIKA